MIMSDNNYDWRYENSINSGKEQLKLNEQEFKYNQWRTNSSLSNYVDTLLYVNEMNMYHFITNQMHYDYLFNSVRKTKRYGKKKTKEDKRLEQEIKKENEKISLIQEYYKYNRTKSKELLNVLSDEQLNYIRKRLEKGGTK